jgi:hypothetical protein
MGKSPSVAGTNPHGIPAKSPLIEYINSVFTLNFPIFLGFFAIYVYIEYP